MDPGYLQWREKHFSSWASQVLVEMERDAAYVNENTQTANSFKSLTCPFQCNLNGDCVDGN